ncbi:hypothetical protein [Ferrovibrio xuzhouensis]|uniref:Uncharacterized protein n=1 Tax=Ferrovibrio xuzhouensis TaxID=1576914 RepID=A0ABV7VB67_9PROT
MPDNRPNPTISHTLAIADQIAAERMRQIHAEGFTIQNDDAYEFGELARAAGSYAITAGQEIARAAGSPLAHAAHHLAPMPATWPFPLQWWKPRDVRGDLIRAGALILAAIESLDRKSGDDTVPGINPFGSGPTEIGLRHQPQALDASPLAGCALYTEAARRFHAATGTSRCAILQGPANDLRAEIAERCARHGFVTRCLPPRNTSGPLHITLTGPAGCGKTTFLNGLADAGFIVRDREFGMETADAEPRESACIYGRPLAPAEVMAQRNAEMQHVEAIGIAAPGP